MADHDTEDDAKTPLMTKEDVYRAFVDKLDFWNDMPVLIRVMSEKFANRRQMKKWSGLADKRKTNLRTVSQTKTTKATPSRRPCSTTTNGPPLNGPRKAPDDGEKAEGGVGASGSDACGLG